ncbi:dipeptide ABC transporter ATP-binding protein [Xylophilus sp. Kf1]|nr:dipeptide ABC transporter ATP-binding protein [Xylophilus sp. Kf1]
MSEPLLDIQGLCVDFHGHGRQRARAVDGLGFAIGAGETVALVGESGSGKSVTAFSLLRLIENAGGTIAAGSARFRRAEGRTVDLFALPQAALRALRGKEISMIFQEPMTALNPVMTVGDQIAEVYRLHERISGAEAMARAERMVEAVRLPEPARRLRQYPGELSGGMRQRVAIAMALACRPQLLIADEPTTALDVTVQSEILALIREMQREMGMAVLFITHDMGVVAEIADRVVVMRQGRKVEEAPVRALFSEPAQAYTRELLAAVPRLGDGSPAPLPAPGAAEGEGAGAPVLEVRGLGKRFPVRTGWFSKAAELHAVEGVSFSLRAGETLGLVGESGSGKSTTGRLVSKLIDASEGSVRLCGRDIGGLDNRAMRPLRADIQTIFQDPYASLNPRLAAWDLVSEPLKLHGRLGAAERRQRAAALMERVGLPASMLDRHAHQFSGGQRQRLCIARALSVRPRIIVADESVSALDVSVQARVIELLQDLQKEHGLAYLFISHDMAVVEKMSHRVAVMYRGRIVEIGPTASVLHAPRHAYTRRLLSAVPMPDPTLRRAQAVRPASAVASPVFPVGHRPAPVAMEEVAEGHFVQSDELH